MIADVKPYSINLGGRLIHLDHTLVMGILNATPDSFYMASRCFDNKDIIASRARQIIDEGGEMIDIGGFSTRPGAAAVTAEEEYRRLSIALEIVRRECGEEIPVSIDTFRADVARRCVESFGPLIINDIAGGNLDEKMFDTVAELRMPYILTHSRGDSQTMQTLTDYGDVVCDVIRDLAEKSDRLARLGVCDVIIDPGFGFAKTIEQNYAMLARLNEFNIFDLPLLVGISRKTMIWKSLGITSDKALNGTSVLNTIAAMEGTHILRVHDVKECVEVVKLTQNTRIQQL